MSRQRPRIGLTWALPPEARDVVGYHVERAGIREGSAFFLIFLPLPQSGCLLASLGSRPIKRK